MTLDYSIELIIMTYNVLHSWKYQKNILIPNLTLAICITCIAIGIKYIMDYKLGFDEFNKHQCTINNITYPTESYSSEYKINWQKCQCNYNGNEIYGVMPCIGLYDTNISDKMIINYFNGPGSQYFGNVGSNKNCTWIASNMCSCENTFELTELYLKNMYNYTIGTNFDCYYKNDNEPQIYFNIGEYSLIGLIFMVIMGIIPVSLTIIYMNFASFYNFEEYMKPLFMSCFDYDRNQRNFYFVDFWMWILLLVKGLIIIGTPIVQCFYELYNCCLIIDTNIYNAVVYCFKIKSGNKKNNDPINDTNGYVEYCHSYGTIDSS